MSPAKRLNAIVLVASLAGISWLGINYFLSGQVTQTFAGGCIIKHLTGYPCPSCGITRALILLISGHPQSAFWLNPFSFILAALIVIAPMWVIYDIFLKKESFYKAYGNVESFLGKRYMAVFLIGIVVINWIWNIYKGL